MRKNLLLLTLLVCFVMCLPAITESKNGPTEKDGYRRPPKNDAFSFPDLNDLPEHKGLPDPFVRADGSKAKTVAEWEEQRAYLKAMLAHYQYGHMPPTPKNVVVERISSRQVSNGEVKQSRINLIISRNGQEVLLRAVIFRPNKPGRFPIVIKNDEFLVDASEVPEQFVRRIYEGRRERIDEFVRSEAIKRGYVYCKFIRTDLAPDERENRHRGVFTLYPEYDWGTIAAWAWGYQVVIDAIGGEDFIDATKICATGHARGGKAALCAGVFDERVKITAPHVSGPGGTGSWRFFDPNQYPWALAAVSERLPHFWVPRLYFFVGHESRMPFDAHFPKALIAPRVLLNTHARHDYSTNPYGTYLTHLAAHPVYKLLGVEENCLVHWRDGEDHCQSKEDWIVLFEVCDRVFWGKPTTREFNNNPFPGRYKYETLSDLNVGGITALHHAVEKGYDVTEKLIDAGVPVNPVDLEGNTPLHYAARSEETGEGIVELLLSKGAKVNARNAKGQTPLDWAKQAKRSKIVALLKKHGAKE
ncbi:MAG: ankyrin repeat domain-containing protein [Sedimentisphaerales bacterium]|nr:ankyrin repeat domain-containing protein [Sedimentisphaerales bacterium]